MNYLVIPAYEPDYNLIKLIEKIHNKSDFYIIVVDDGSSTKCQDIFARSGDFATVLHHEVNQGKGQALKTAFEYIQSLNKPGTVVTADADGQHRIWDIFRNMTKSNENPNTLVLGVRAFTGKVPLRSRFGNSLTRILFKLQTGVAVSDTQTGLRAFPIRDGLMIYKNILKFALSSFSSFIVDYVVYSLSILCLSFIPTGLRVLLSNGLARVTSSIFNFSTNKKLVFKNKASSFKTGSGYFGLAVGLFILDTILIRLFNSGLGVNLLIAKIIVGIMLFILSWTIQTRFIFKERTCIPL